ncbi:MAG: FG-GAP repeat protein [Verrucomicrobiota bacterium]
MPLPPTPSKPPFAPITAPSEYRAGKNANASARPPSPKSCKGNILVVLGVVVLLGFFGEAHKTDFLRHGPSRAIPAKLQSVAVEPPASGEPAIVAHGLPNSPVGTSTPATAPPSPMDPRTPRTVAETDPSLSEAFNKARLALRSPGPAEKGDPLYAGVQYLGSNPGQRLRAQFRAGSVQLGQEGDASWQATFRYRPSGGAPNGQKAAPLPEAGGAQAAFQHETGVREWYINRAEGWEHGFHLAQRPLGTPGGGEFRLQVEVEGLKARPDRTPGREAGLELVHPASGKPVLRYDGLKVWDALGKPLPARLEAPGGSISILIADAGAVYPLTVDPLITSTAEKVVSPRAPGPGGYSNFFGHAVALSGDTALIGAYLDSSPGMIYDGAVYVFVREAGEWIFQQRLAAPDGTDKDHFGITVALSGNTALVGMQPDGGGESSARVFVRDGTTWTLQAKLQTPGSTYFEYFGFAVALDGDTAAVTAIAENTPAGDGSGAAYVFVRTGTSWAEQARLVPDSPAARQNFGNSVSLSGDTVLIGHKNDETGAGQGAGSAYVFVRTGAAWTQQAKLQAPDGYIGDNFGEGVALSGHTALVGAPGADVLPSTNGAGKAYVFIRTGATWSLQAELTAATRGELDIFGYAVALDGDTAAVGAPLKDTEEAANGFPKGERGVVRVFSRSGGVWRPEQTIEAADGEKDDQFGVSVALSGTTLIVGADFDDYATNVNAGSAWLYNLSSVPPGDTLRSVQMLQGTVVIRGLATPGSTFLMQRSSTGAGGWQQIGEDIVVPEDGHFLFRDPAPPETRGFYRLARR